MKKILLIFFLLFVCVIIGVFLGVVHSFNAENYRTQLIKDLSQMTGRTVEIHGDVSFSWTPLPTVVVSDLTVSNQEDSPNPTMFSVKKVYAEIEWKSLFKSPLVIRKVILESPDLLLERVKSYQTNFDFPILFKNVSLEDNSFIDEGKRYSISINEIEIREGTFTYANNLAHEKMVLNEINGKGEISSLAGPFSFEGNFSLDGFPKTINLRFFKIETSQPISFVYSLEDKPSETIFEGEGTISLNSKDWLNFSGVITSKNFSDLLKNYGISGWSKGETIGSFLYKVMPEKSVLDNLTIRQKSEDGGASFFWERQKNDKGKEFPTIVLKNVDYLQIKDLLEKIKKSDFSQSKETDFHIQIEDMKVKKQVLPKVIMDVHLKDKVLNFSDLTAQLPNESSLGLKGIFDLDKSFLDADVQVQTTDVRALSELFLNEKITFLPENKFKNFQYVGHLKGELKNFILQITSATLDESQFSGELVLNLNEPLNCKISLDLKDIDLDSYIKPENNPFEKMFSMNGNYSFHIKGENLKVNSYTFKNLETSFKMEKKHLLIEKFSATTEDSSSFDGNAAITVLEEEGTVIDNLHINFSLADGKYSEKFITLFPYKFIIEKLKDIKGSFDYKGTLKKGEFQANFESEQNKISTRGGIVSPLENMELLDLNFSFSGPEIQKFIPPQEKFKFLNLKGDFRFDSKGSGNLNKFSQKFTSQIGKQFLNGNMDWDLKEKALKINLMSPDLDLDAFLPPLSDINLEKDTPFDIEIDPKWQLDFHLKANKTKYSKMNYRDIQMEATLKDQVLDISSLNISSLDQKGQISFGGNITFRSPIIVQGKLNFSKVLLNKKIIDLDSFSLSKGILNLDSSLVSSGNSWPSFVKNIRGDGKFSWSDLTLTGVDFKDLLFIIESAVKQSKIERKELEAQMKKALSNGETRISSLSGEFNINQGIFSFSDLKGNSIQSQFVLPKGEYSLLDKALNSALSVSFQKFKTLPSLEIQIQNNVFKPKLDVFYNALVQGIKDLKVKEEEKEKRKEEREAKKQQDKIISSARQISEKVGLQLQKVEDLPSFKETSEENEIIMKINQAFSDVQELMAKPDLNGEQLTFLDEKSKLLDSYSKELDISLERQDVLKQRESIQKLPPLVKNRLSELIQIYEQNPQFSVLAGILKGAQNEDKKINDKLKELENTTDMEKSKEIIEEIKLSFQKIQKGLNYAKKLDSVTGMVPAVSGSVTEGGS